MEINMVEDLDMFAAEVGESYANAKMGAYCL